MFDGMASLDSLWELLLEAAGRQSASVRFTGAQAYAHILHGSAFPAESTPVQDMPQLVARLTAGMAVLLLEGCSSGIVFPYRGSSSAPWKNHPARAICAVAGKALPTF